MADPISILAAPNGLQVLDSSPYSVDDVGLTRAVVNYICYPPDPSKYPRLGSRHPNYPALLLAEIETKIDVFAFITGIYYGIIGDRIEREEYREWYEMVSPITYKQVTQGDTTYMQMDRPAVYQHKYTRSFRGVSESQPSSYGENWSITATQKGHVWIYTREYSWASPLPLPQVTDSGSSI